MEQITIRKIENKIKINNAISGKFQFIEGARQGDPISSVIFCLCLEKVIRETNINREGLLYHRKPQWLAFANDGAVLTTVKHDLREAVRRLDKVTKK